MGHLDQPYKGVAVLLESLRSLRRSGAAVHLTVVGGGRLQADLQELTRDQGTAGDVSFLGQLDRDGVQRALDAAQLFVLPSLTEGLPRALLEAMARGLPAIATRVGGVPELLPEECLVPAGNAEALVRKILDVAHDDGARTAWGRRNREVAMLVSHSRSIADCARHLAAQARDPAPHYEHSQVGFNYRMSNLLAAIGRAQLQRLDEKIAKRRSIRARYARDLEPLGGIRILEDAGYGRSNAWLTCITIEPQAFGATNEAIRQHLESLDVESRPVWKPMHLQPAFRKYPVCAGSVAARLFRTGLCLPSGSRLSSSEQTRVITGIEETPRFAGRSHIGGRMARV